MELQPRGATREAVTVEAIGSGVSQQTVVTHRIWVGETVHEDSRVFASLTEALVYANEISKGPDPDDPEAELPEAEATAPGESEPGSLDCLRDEMF